MIKSIIVGVVELHDDGIATQRVWTDVPACVAGPIAAQLGSPDASSMMTAEQVDGVDEAMRGVPMVFGDEVER